MLIIRHFHSPDVGHLLMNLYQIDSSPLSSQVSTLSSPLPIKPATPPNMSNSTTAKPLASNLLPLAVFRFRSRCLSIISLFARPLTESTVAGIPIAVRRNLFIFFRLLLCMVSRCMAAGPEHREPPQPPPPVRDLTPPGGRQGSRRTDFGS